MTIVQQPTFIDIEILMQLDIKERHAEIFSPINFTPIFELFQKNSSVGAPISINYEATIRAIITKYIENIPSVKALVRRLNEDISFKLSLGFLFSQRIPSETTFCRIMKRLSENLEVLEQLNRDLLAQINDEFDIYSEEISVDATAIEAHSKSKKTVNDKITISAIQKEMSTDIILRELPIYPSWGVKANSKGKNNYWFGYKNHYAVSSRTQYILAEITTSAFVADISVAVPLLRKLSDLGVKNTFVLMDKGYDAQAVYEQAHLLKFEPIIDLKKASKNNGEADKYNRPTCLLEHSYCYDSFDKRYNALKFKKPVKHCKECPLKNEEMCQKVIKIKQSTDFRKYNNPSRGTKAWNSIYKHRSSVERVNAYVKGNYGINRSHYYFATRVATEHQLIQLAYNLKTYGQQRLSKKETVM